MMLVKENITNNYKNIKKLKFHFCYRRKKNCYNKFCFNGALINLILL